MGNPPVPPLSRQRRDGTTEYYNPYSGRYTRNRDYGLRMQRGYARGLSQHTARGQKPAESVRRRERVVRETGQTPWQLYGIGFQQRYGFSYNYWRKLRKRYIAEINKRSSPGAQILPSHIQDIIQLYNMGWTDLNRPELRTWQEWVEVHLGERLWSTILYQDEGESAYGAFNFTFRNSVAPIEFWYYH